MAKITTKIELSEKELLEVLSNHYTLDNGSIRIHSHGDAYSPDPRERSTYNTIVVEGTKKP